MENRQNAPDLYEREEQCIKSIKTLRRALGMRIVVALVMIWAVAMVPTQPMVWGLTVFVLVMDILGAVPLITELKKQMRLLDDLIAQEEE